jgi:threonine dehydratase
VVATLAPAVRTAWTTGEAARVKPASVADGLGAPVADLGVVRVLQQVLRDLLPVEDAAILDAQRRLALDAKLVAEPAGAAALAAALAHADLPRPLVCVVSGGNADPALLARTIAGA